MLLGGVRLRLGGLAWMGSISSALGGGIYEVAHVPLTTGQAGWGARSATGGGWSCCPVAGRSDLSTETELVLHERACPSAISRTGKPLGWPVGDDSEV